MSFSYLSFSYYKDTTIILIHQIFLMFFTTFFILQLTAIRRRRRTDGCQWISDMTRDDPEWTAGPGPGDLSVLSVLPACPDLQIPAKLRWKQMSPPHPDGGGTLQCNVVWYESYSTERVRMALRDVSVFAVASSLLSTEILSGFTP